MLLHKLEKKKLIHPPKWLSDNCAYLTVMGSQAYGVGTDDSDVDVYGVTIPPKNEVFPHLKGEILGFGRQIQRFEQWQEHHIIDTDKKKQYDFQVYNIVKYFHLCMENNPNMIDSLFTPRRCVIHITSLGNHIRDNRKIFLHKGSWYKFKGYAYSQMHKIDTKSNASSPKRDESIKKFVYDVKFAYHLVRLLNEVEQIMVEHDLDLERNREQLKNIRRGEWSLEQVKDYFQSKERALEEVYANSTLKNTNQMKKRLNLFY
jgi:predicted nucleotidyltransferase